MKAGGGEGSRLSVSPGVGVGSMDRIIPVCLMFIPLAYFNCVNIYDVSDSLVSSMRCMYICCVCIFSLASRMGKNWAAPIYRKQHKKKRRRRKERGEKNRQKIEASVGCRPGSLAGHQSIDLEPGTKLRLQHPLLQHPRTKNMQLTASGQAKAKSLAGSCR